MKRNQFIGLTLGALAAGAAADVGYVASLIQGALANYEEVAARYDLVSIREVDEILNQPAPAATPAPAALPQSPEAATANTAN